MLFSRNNDVHSRRIADHCFAVERLDCADVENSCGYSFRLQNLRGIKRPRNHDAGGEDGDVFPIPELGHLADVVRLADRIHKREIVAVDTEVHRPRPIQHAVHHLLNLDGVRRAKHGHVWKSTHQGSVFNALMGLAIAEVGKSGAGSADADRKVGNADGVAELIVRSSGGKHSKRMNERNHSGEGEAGRGRGHVLFRDSHLEVPIRKLGLEHGGLRGLAEVSLEGHNALIFFTQPYQAGSIGKSQVWRSHCSILRVSSISTSALSYCSWLMMPLWKAAVFSAKETPFPLTVSATITVGPPLNAAASSRTSRMAPTSCPSTVNTFHPKARHFSSMLGMSKISLV